MWILWLKVARPRIFVDTPSIFQSLRLNTCITHRLNFIMILCFRRSEKISLDGDVTILKRSWILVVVLKSPWIQIRSLKSTWFLYMVLKSHWNWLLCLPHIIFCEIREHRKLEHRKNKRYKTEKKFNGVKWKQMVSIKPEATIFYLSFYISNAISVSQTASHTQWLLTFCKVVLLRKVVQHIVRDDQPWLKM